MLSMFIDIHTLLAPFVLIPQDARAATGRLAWPAPELVGVDADPTTPLITCSTGLPREMLFLPSVMLNMVIARAGACWRPPFDDLVQDVAPA